MTARTFSLERGISLGLIVLVAVMPFHAFLSVWLGSLTGHQAIIQAWKEVLIVGLVAASVLLVFRDRSRLQRLRKPWVAAAGIFTLIALVVSLALKVPWPNIIFGLKIDVEFIVAGIIATLVGSQQLRRNIAKTLIITGSVVGGFAAAQLFILPADFLTHFGYGPTTIAPFQHIAAGSSALRFPSTLGGPNQLGSFLLLPYALALFIAVGKRSWSHMGASSLMLIGIFVSQSRAAWGAALLVSAIIVTLATPAKLRQWVILSWVVLAGAFVVSLPAILSSGGPLQYYLLHSSVEDHDDGNLSDSQHKLSLEEGSRQTLDQPLGHGLGTAGPATFTHGPTNIIENNYLQISYETGILGLIAFLACVGLLMWRMLNFESPLQIATLAAFCGISIISLVLPAWTDSSTALVAWIAAGASLKHRHE